MQVLRSSRSSSTSATSSPELEEWTSMEIVKVVYKEVPESLHAPAHGGVLQVLRKLKDEDKIVEDSSSARWRLKDRSAL